MKIIQKINSFLKDESGVVWVFAIVLVPVFIAFGALAMDGSNLYTQSRGIQNSADSLVMWSVSPTNYSALLAADPNSTKTTAIPSNVQSYITSIGTNNTGVQGLNVQSWSAGLYDLSKSATTGIIASCPTGSTCASAVQVTVCGNVKTFIGGLLGTSTFPVCRTATAITGLISSVSPGNLCPIAISQCMYEDGNWDWTTNPQSPNWSHNSDHFYNTATRTPNSSNDFKWGVGHGDEGSGSSDRDSCGSSYQHCKGTAWFHSFGSTTPKANSWSSDSKGLDTNNKNANTCSAGDNLNLITTPPSGKWNSAGKVYNSDQDSKWFNNITAATSCWVPIVDTKNDTDSNRHVVAFANWDVTGVCSAQKNISIDGVSGHYIDSDGCDYGPATVVHSDNGYISAKTLTIFESSANFKNGQMIYGPGVQTGTSITAVGSCFLGVCSYTISSSQTVGNLFSPIIISTYNVDTNNPDKIYPYVKGHFHQGLSQVSGGSWGAPWALNYSGATSPVLVPNDR